MEASVASGSSEGKQLCLATFVEGLPTMQLKKHCHLTVIGTCLTGGMVNEDAYHAVITCPSAAVFGRQWGRSGSCQKRKK